jgi:hypothetical protein
MREVCWPARVGTVVNPTVARIPALRLETGDDLGELTPPAPIGPVDVYVDPGSDFAAGPKRTAVRRATAGGLSLARTRIDARDEAGTYRSRRQAWAPAYRRCFG